MTLRLLPSLSIGSRLDSLRRAAEQLFGDQVTVSAKTDRPWSRDADPKLPEQLEVAITIGLEQQWPELDIEQALPAGGRGTGASAERAADAPTFQGGARIASRAPAGLRTPDAGADERGGVAPPCSSVVDEEDPVSHEQMADVHKRITEINVELAAQIATAQQRAHAAARDALEESGLTERVERLERLDADRGRIVSEVTEALRRRVEALEVKRDLDAAQPLYVFGGMTDEEKAVIAAAEAYVDAPSYYGKPYTDLEDATAALRAARENREKGAADGGFTATIHAGSDDPSQEDAPANVAADVPRVSGTSPAPTPAADAPRYMPPSEPPTASTERGSGCDAPRYMGAAADAPSSFDWDSLDEIVTNLGLGRYASSAVMNSLRKVVAPVVSERDRLREENASLAHDAKFTRDWRADPAGGVLLARCEKAEADNARLSQRVAELERELGDQRMLLDVANRMLKTIGDIVPPNTDSLTQNVALRVHDLKAELDRLRAAPPTGGVTEAMRKAIAFLQRGDCISWAGRAPERCVITFENGERYHAWVRARNEALADLAALAALDAGTHVLVPKDRAVVLPEREKLASVILEAGWRGGTSWATQNEWSYAAADAAIRAFRECNAATVRSVTAEDVREASTAAFGPNRAREEDAIGDAEIKFAAALNARLFGDKAGEAGRG